MTSPILISTVPRWRRALWVLAGGVALMLGLVGIFLPLVPTVPFVLLAAFCFSRGSERCERWILAHPRFGPLVSDWRTHRSIPRGVKWLATAMMSVSSGLAWWLMPSHVGWIPGACCALVAAWLWRLPTRVT